MNSVLIIEQPVEKDRYEIRKMPGFVLVATKDTFDEAEQTASYLEDMYYEQEMAQWNRYGGM